MYSNNLKIEIRMIPNRGDIKSYSENLEYFSQSHTIAPFVNPVTRRYETGLSKEDVAYLKEEGFPYDLSDVYIQGVAHPFWENRLVKVDLKSTPDFLFPGKSLLDFVKYKYLLASNYIYSSEEEMKSGSKSLATHYIYNDEEFTDIRATEVEKRNSLILKVSELSLERKRAIVLIILNENTDNKNDSYLTLKLDNIINNKLQAKELSLLLEEKSNSISLQADIISAIQKNVLKRTKQGIFYYETNLGFDEQAVKEFLETPENQEILLNIKSKL